MATKVNDWYQCKNCGESVTCTLPTDPIRKKAFDRLVRNNPDGCPWYNFRPSTRRRRTYV